ncbi:MAG: hypothetical protein AAFZ58_02405 [Pseudomonadota bacterium]
MRRFIVMFLAGIAFIAAAVAQDAGQQSHRIEVYVNDGEPVQVEIDGDVSMFDAKDLAVGEERRIVTDGGKEIVIARADSGVSVSVDGREFAIPTIDANAFANSKAVHVVKRVEVEGEATNGIMLIPGRELDPTEQEALEAAILATGITENVTFLPAAGGKHRQVRIRTDASE